MEKYLFNKPQTPHFTKIKVHKQCTRLNLTFTKQLSWDTCMYIINKNKFKNRKILVKPLEIVKIILSLLINTKYFF